MRSTLLPAAVVLLGLAGCGTQGEEQLRENLSAATAQVVAPSVPDSGEGEEPEGVTEPVRVPSALVDTEGSVIGAAYLVDGELGAEVAVEIRGMTPGFHGMGLYEAGECAIDGPSAQAFASVGDLLVALPPVLVLENGVGAATVLVDTAPVVEELLALDGTALVIGESAADLRFAEALPVGSRTACAAFGEDTELEPVERGEEGSEDVEGEDDPDGLDRGTGGLENDDDEDTGTP
jgi:Cu/Zn superoxide dismutase